MRVKGLDDRSDDRKELTDSWHVDSKNPVRPAIKRVLGNL